MNSGIITIARNKDGSFQKPNIEPDSDFELDRYSLRLLLMYRKEDVLRKVEVHEEV